MDKMFTEMKAIVSILGKPYHLMTLAFYVLMGVVMFMTYKQSPFKEVYWNYSLILGEFVCFMFLIHYSSSKASDYDVEAEKRAKDYAKELDEHKTILADQTVKQAIIKEATDKVMSWSANPTVGVPMGKFDQGYGISIEVKVLQTCKYAFVRDNGRQITKAKLP